MPVNPDQRFTQSELDNLTDAQIADLLNKAAAIKKKNPGYNSFQPARQPQRANEVDLSQWFGGIDGPPVAK